MVLPNWATAAFEEYRGNRIAAYLSEFVGASDTVLDCGCGSVFVAQSLGRRSGARVFGADVIRLNRADLSMCLCAGERLSFADESFETVCLIFVLHHAAHPVQVLGECLRVAGRRVIVLEDVYRNGLELQWLKAMDWIGNRPVSAEMNLPFNFRSEREWLQVFKGLGVDLVEVASVRPLPWLPVQHRGFVLNKRRHDQPCQ
jgi:SAM-dependent methyltransferase